MRRLANHLLQQRSFYPLYPPSEEINIDLEQLESLGKLDVQPHVLILPSDLLHFFKDINGGLGMLSHKMLKMTIVTAYTVESLIESGLYLGFGICDQDSIRVRTLFKSGLYKKVI